MTVDDIALTMQHGLGVKGVVGLLSLAGTAENIYKMSEHDLVAREGMRADVARGIIGKACHRQAEKELKYMAANGIVAVASTDDAYPVLLAECPDYPHVLYVRGNVDVLTGKLVAMVGTREATPYGQRMCDVLVGRIAELCPDAVIVSGLAFGVDSACHRAALAYGLKTIAVIANALPEVTPSQHRRLADEIVERGGAIVTELNSHTKQNGAYFIPRNRIIAGMSEGTVVVESPYDGGSLSTAELAYSYNRLLMAVPGRASDRASVGANRLIRHRKAAMVCSGDDIVHELGWDITVPGRIPDSPADRVILSPDEKRLLDCFGTGESLDLDAICLRTGMHIGEIMAMLLSLEMAGVVRSLPGRMYEKKF